MVSPISSCHHSPVVSPIFSCHYSPMMSSVSLCCPKLQVLELPVVSLSWRLKATQQHSSPISRPVNSRLIPQITYLTQVLATMDDAIDEEEEVDGLFTQLSATVTVVGIINERK